MKTELALIALIVDEYDRAIEYYTRTLGFTLTEDKKMEEEGKRWVVVHPPGSSGCGFLLAKAKTERQKSAIGNQTGGRVFLFLHTDDLSGYLQRLTDAGVEIVRGPVVEEYGKVLVFKDVYGNLWDLIQPV